MKRNSSARAQEGPLGPEYRVSMVAWETQAGQVVCWGGERWESAGEPVYSMSNLCMQLAGWGTSHRGDKDGT